MTVGPRDSHSVYEHSPNMYALFRDVLVPGMIRIYVFVYDGMYVSTKKNVS